ncbi:MAG: hypothetical protein ACT4OG_06600 [Alphaproteobacteria bacterium]
MGQIFPKQADNSYRGHWLAILLLALVVLLKGTQGAVSIFNTRNVLTTADGIPLASYGAAAGDTVVALTALLGLLLVALALIAIIVLIRYRALIPLMFLVQLFVQGGSRVLLEINAVERVVQASAVFAGQPIGFWVNMGILALT